MSKACKSCGSKHYGRGYCRSCYRKAQKRGEFGGKRCSAEGCDGFAITIGLCANCYKRLQRKGTIDAIKVKNLPGEEWLPIEREKFSGIYVSNLGRVKSCRKKDEVLLSPKMRLTTKDKKEPVFAAFTKGGTIHVALEVLRAFKVNNNKDTTFVFKDKNPANCRIDNLEWYGRDLLVDKAIKGAEASDHPLADCFLRFWHGEHEAINDWLESLQDSVRGYLYKRLQNYNFPWFMDLDDCVQQSLYDIFIALYRGMFAGFEHLHGWVLRIASAALSRSLKLSKKRMEPLDIPGDNGEYSKADINLFCHPSAELQAIYNEEVTA